MTLKTGFDPYFDANQPLTKPPETMSDTPHETPNGTGYTSEKKVGDVVRIHDYSQRFIIDAIFQDGTAHLRNVDTGYSHGESVPLKYLRFDSEIPLPYNTQPWHSPIPAETEQLQINIICDDTGLQKGLTDALRPVLAQHLINLIRDRQPIPKSIVKQYNELLKSNEQQTATTHQV